MEVTYLAVIIPYRLLPAALGVAAFAWLRNGRAHRRVRHVRRVGQRGDPHALLARALQVALKCRRRRFGQ